MEPCTVPLWQVTLLGRQRAAGLECWRESAVVSLVSRPTAKNTRGTAGWCHVNGPSGCLIALKMRGVLPYKHHGTSARV